MMKILFYSVRDMGVWFIAEFKNINTSYNGRLGIPSLKDPVFFCNAVIRLIPYVVKLRYFCCREPGSRE